MKESVRCRTCRKQFKKSFKEIKKTNNNFCSKSCAATYNNKKFPKRKKLKKTCLTCGAILSKNEIKFCTRECGQEHKYNSLVSDWLSGNISGNNKSSKPRTFVRKYLYRTRGKKCEKCGWNEINPTTGKTPLEIDHIDGNYKRTVPENLNIVCPNCHSLTSTYRALNKGNGRPK